MNQIRLIRAGFNCRSLLERKLHFILPLLGEFLNLPPEGADDDALFKAVKVEETYGDVTVNFALFTENYWTTDDNCRIEAGFFYCKNILKFSSESCRSNEQLT